MEAVYSVLEFLLSVPVGEMLTEYIVIIGVISLIKDEVRRTDTKHLTTGNGFVSKRNKNAPNNLGRNGLSVAQVDYCDDFKRKKHLDSEFDTDLTVGLHKFSDKNSNVLKTDFLKERKQSKELHQERQEGENIAIIANVGLRLDRPTSNLTISSTDKDSVKEEHLMRSGQTTDEHSNTIQKKAFREISESSRVDQNSENMAQDDEKTKSLTSNDDHVDRLGNVYASSGEEDSFYDCENLDSNSPKAEKTKNSNIASGPEGSEILAKKYENTEKRLSSRGSEPRDRLEEQKPDRQQVALLCQDEDNFRLWNEQLLKENDEFSCEITLMRRDFHQLRQENEQLKKDKKELLELMELLQLKKDTGVPVERAKSTADLTDGSEAFVREQPLGASSAEELSSPPHEVKEEEEAESDKREMAAPVASTVDVQIRDQTRIQEREKRYSRLLFQFVFVGDSGVGKTSFIKRFCDGKFSSKFNTTVGVDFLMKTLTIDDSQIFLQIWDTAGQERFRSITRQYFRKADGVVVMYDVTSENSFKSVRNWMNSVQESSVDGIVVAVVGNKRDLVDDADSGRVVTSADGANLAKDFNAFFYECSAKTGQGLDRTMVDMASLLFRRRNLDDYQKQSSVVILNKSRFSARRSNCCMTSRTRNRSDVIHSL